METNLEENYYDQRCGEVFLTDVGDFVVHCTICEKKYHAFSEYADHVREAHVCTNYEVDFLDEHYESEAYQQTLHDDAPEIFTSLVSKEDIDKFEEIEFLAPEPDECKEIENFVRNYNEDEKIQRQADNLNTRTVRKRIVKKHHPSDMSLYSCPYCEATSHSRKSMNEHKLRHKGVLRHKCEMCGKAFFSTSELAVHMRTHTGERPYLCSDCGHKCATASALRAHIRSCRDIRDAQCQVCSKMFRNEMYLQRHMISHSDERNFKCTMCTAKFKQKKALQSHVKIHENQHTYKCDMCPASFNQRPGLSSHMKSKHKYFIKSIENI